MSLSITNLLFNNKISRRFVLHCILYKSFSGPLLFPFPSDDVLSIPSRITSRTITHSHTPARQEATHTSKGQTKSANKGGNDAPSKSCTAPRVRRASSYRSAVPRWSDQVSQHWRDLSKPHFWLYCPLNASSEYTPCVDQEQSAIYRFLANNVILFKPR